MPKLKVENLYNTIITSVGGIPSSGDCDFTVAVAPENTNGFIIISPDNSIRREIMYYHNVVGNRIYVRGENRIEPKSHTTTEPVKMNDVAEIFNTFSDMISQAFYVEKTGGLTVRVWGGYVYYNGLPVSVPDANLTMADNATNYIKYSYNTNSFSVDTVDSGNIKAQVVTIGGAITSIGYRTAKESYIDFTVALTGALPPQAGQDGKVLTTDGTNVSWEEVVIPNATDSTTGLTELATISDINNEIDTVSGNPLAVQPSALSTITAHKVPNLIDMTAPMAVDSFDTQSISSGTAGNSSNRLAATFVNGGSSSQFPMTYVFTPNKNVFLYSATYSQSNRSSPWTITLTETVGGTVIYTGAGVTGGLTDIFGSGVFLRKGISYTVATACNSPNTYSYTYPTGDLVVSSLTAGRNIDVLTFNYAVANNIPFGLTTVSHITTPVSATGGSISQIQVALRKIGTPPQVVTVQLLNAAGSVITGASGTISSGTITTTQANYNVTLSTPYIAVANEKLFVQVSTTGSNNSNHYFIYGSTELSTLGVNSYTNTDTNPLFYSSITSASLNRYVGVPCHPTRLKLCGLIKKTYAAGSMMNLFIFGYLPYTGLLLDTTYYVNSDNSGGITSSSGSGVIVGRTYITSFIAKIF